MDENRRAVDRNRKRGKTGCIYQPVDKIADNLFLAYLWHCHWLRTSREFMMALNDINDTRIYKNNLKCFFSWENSSLLSDSASRLSCSSKTPPLSDHSTPNSLPCFPLVIASLQTSKFTSRNTSAWLLSVSLAAQLSWWSSGHPSLRFWSSWGWSAGCMSAMPLWLRSHPSKMPNSGNPLPSWEESSTFWEPNHQELLQKSSKNDKCISYDFLISSDSSWSDF